MPALPTLIYDKKTRTGNEAYVYYNLDVGLKVRKRTHQNGSVVVTELESCGGDDQCPSNAFTATYLEVPNQAAAGSIPEKSSQYTAKEGVHAPATPGDTTTEVCLPDPANDVLICFDRGYSFTPGATRRPIPVKLNPADHYVQQRPDNSLSLTDLYVHNAEGLARIRGRRCTIIVKISPDATGVFSEIHYYNNVFLNPQTPGAPGESNDSIEVTMEGTYSFACIFH